MRYERVSNTQITVYRSGVQPNFHIGGTKRELDDLEDQIGRISNNRRRRVTEAARLARRRPFRNQETSPGGYD